MRAADATTEDRASSDSYPARSYPATIRGYAALAGAGFRRHATYRQAMVAAACTNSVFGFLRCYAILAAAAGAGGVAAGYSRERLATFVWAGQGLIGTVLLWAPPELAERIRTGEVVVDLLRPINLVWRELAGDLGRAGYGALTRFVIPVTVGILTFDLYRPRRLATYPIFVCSVALAAVVCFGCRYLVNIAAFWLLDARGPHLAWAVFSTALTGMAFPLTFLPGWVYGGLRFATPLPSIIQTPLDILVERGSTADQFGRLALQAGWAALLLAGCRYVQHRAERRLVIQGG